MNIVENKQENKQNGFTVFVYQTGDSPPPVTACKEDTLRSVLARGGITDTDDLVAFFPKDEHGNEGLEIEDAEHEKEALDRTLESLGIGRGARIVMSPCKWVEVGVNYQNETAKRKFRPSARVGLVLRWARNHWHLNAEDFESIKLRLCGHTDDLSESIRLAQLVRRGTCNLCLELVPVPKVNG